MPATTPLRSMRSSCQISISTDSSSETIDLDYPLDSINRRRRHGVYFHRPAVWFPGPCCHEDSSADSKGCGLAYSWDIRNLQSPCEHFDVLHHQRQSSEMCLECQADGTRRSEVDTFDIAEINMEDERWKLRARSWLQEPLRKDMPDSHTRDTSESSQDDSFLAPFRQKKAGLCTRLHSCKDIRVGKDECWAIREGSLVVCIDPIYTLLDHETRAADEFELAYGDFYVVCRMYADLWALCAKISFNNSDDCSGTQRSFLADSSMHLAFLPLCAVTLAANFTGFMDRCSRYLTCTQAAPRYPGNGLSVAPPERSDSLTASEQISRVSDMQLELPAIAHEACSSFALDSKERSFVPLDSTIRRLFSEVGDQRQRASQLRRQISLKRIWRGLRASESLESEGGTVSSGPTSSKESENTNRRQRGSRGSFSSAGQSLKRLVRMSTSS